jgi:hypothetical protein
MYEYAEDGNFPPDYMALDPGNSHWQRSLIAYVCDTETLTIVLFHNITSVDGDLDTDIHNQRDKSKYNLPYPFTGLPNLGGNEKR